MRFVLRVMCAAALAGCSDVKAPVEPKNSPLLPKEPIDQHPAANEPRIRLDPRPLAVRLEALFGTGLAKVTIPADEFSQSSDAVHPDIACPPVSWNGGRCWLMYTPYKNSNPSFENPAFLLATNDTTWTTPPQVSNPLVAYPGASGYNSDP